MHEIVTINENQKNRLIIELKKKLLLPEYYNILRYIVHTVEDAVARTIIIIVAEETTALKLAAELAAERFSDDSEMLQLIRDGVLEKMQVLRDAVSDKPCLLQAYEKLMLLIQINAQKEAEIFVAEIYGSLLERRYESDFISDYAAICRRYPHERQEDMRCYQSILKKLGFGDCLTDTFECKSAVKEKKQNDIERKSAIEYLENVHHYPFGSELTNKKFSAIFSDQKFYRSSVSGNLINEMALLTPFGQELVLFRETVYAYKLYGLVPSSEGYDQVQSIAEHLGLPGNGENYNAYISQIPLFLDLNKNYSYVPPVGFRDYLRKTYGIRSEAELTEKRLLRFFYDPIIRCYVELKDFVKRALCAVSYSRRRKMISHLKKKSLFRSPLTLKEYLFWEYGIANPEDIADKYQIIKIVHDPYFFEADKVVAAFTAIMLPLSFEQRKKIIESYPVDFKNAISNSHASLSQIILLNYGVASVSEAVSHYQLHRIRYMKLDQNNPDYYAFIYQCFMYKAGLETSDSADVEIPASLEEYLRHESLLTDNIKDYNIILTDRFLESRIVLRHPDLSTFLRSFLSKIYENKNKKDLIKGIDFDQPIFDIASAQTKELCQKEYYLNLSNNENRQFIDFLLKKYPGEQMPEWLTLSPTDNLIAYYAILVKRFSITSFFDINKRPLMDFMNDAQLCSMPGFSSLLIDYLEFHCHNSAMLRQICEAAIMEHPFSSQIIQQLRANGRIPGLEAIFLQTKSTILVYFNSLKFLVQTIPDNLKRQNMIQIFCESNLVLAASIVNGIYDDTRELDAIINKAILKEYKALSDKKMILKNQTRAYNLAAALLLFHDYTVFGNFMREIFCPFIAENNEVIHAGMLARELENDDLLRFFTCLTENDIEDHIPPEVLRELLGRNLEDPTMQEFLQVLFRKGTVESLALLMQITQELSFESICELLHISEEKFSDALVPLYLQNCYTERIMPWSNDMFFEEHELPQLFRRLYKKNTTESLWEMLDVARAYKRTNLSDILKISQRLYQKRISHLNVMKNCSLQLYLFGKYEIDADAGKILPDKVLYRLARDPDTELIDGFYRFMFQYMWEHPVPAQVAQIIGERLVRRCGKHEEAAAIGAVAAEGNYAVLLKYLILLPDMPAYFHDFGIEPISVPFPDISELEELIGTLRDEKSALKWLTEPENSLYAYSPLNITNSSSVLEDDPYKLLESIFRNYRSPETVFRVFINSPLRFWIELKDIARFLTKTVGSKAAGIIASIEMSGHVSSIAADAIHVFPFPFRCEKALKLDMSVNSIRYKNQFYSPAVGDTLFFRFDSISHNQKIEVCQPSFMPGDMKQK